MKLRHSARTDVGKTRDHNEDNFGVGEGQHVEQMGELLVVCDGMGGHAAGEVASQIGVETILRVYYEDTSEDRPQVLKQAFERANAEIYARGQGSMGTTGVAALLHHDALHVANVGDSRAYLIRNHELRQISRDHSFVNDQVTAGLITADQARLSPHRNVITRALGYQPEVTVDLFRLPLQIGDIILLSSDGMHGLVLDDEIVEIASSLPPDQAAQRLIDLANSRGGTDNITVVVAQVEALEWYSAEDTGAPDPTLQERVTVPLPTTAALAANGVLAEPATVPATTTERLLASAAPAERRLSVLGGLLALALLSILIGIIVLAMNTAPVLAPGASTTPAGAPAPTAATTPAAPTSAATQAPASAPTANPTGPANPTPTTATP